MRTAVIGFVVVFLIVGVVLGWHSQKVTAAQSDVKVAKTRLAGGRRTRWRSGVVVLAIGVCLLLALADMVRH
jgi:hypothetical protein